MPTLLASLCLLALLLAAPHDDELHWLLVRGETADVGGLGWQRIGEACLSRWPWRTVHAEEMQSDPTSHRLVVGTPADNAAVLLLGAGLGLRWQERRLLLGDSEIATGTGLVLVTPDPDGAGLLVLFTGADEASVYECFRAPVDLLAPGTTLVRDGHRVSPAALAHYATGRVEVVRLDRLVDEALAPFAGAAPDGRRDGQPSPGDGATTTTTGERWTLADRALAASRAVAGWAHVYASLLPAGGDLLDWHRELLWHHGRAIDEARERYAGRDLAGWARQAVLDAEGALLLPGSERPGPRPAFHFLYAPPGGTNAAVFGNDPVSGRPAILINLCALPDPAALRVTLVHEALHTLQPPRGGRLLDRALHEGLAARLSQRLRPGTSDETALMWTREQLAEARARHDEIVAAFRRQAASTDVDVQARWLVLGRSPEAPAGLPERCGYYVGWTAVGAWIEAHPGQTLHQIASTAADELLAALR